MCIFFKAPLSHRPCIVVGQAFAEEAGRTALVIAEEHGLCSDAKTILPSDAFGGHAGGQKFLYHGIIYKVANSAASLFGGHHYAMKAASHELKGMNARPTNSPPNA